MTGVVKVVHSWSDVRDAVVAALSAVMESPPVSIQRPRKVYEPDSRKISWESSGKPTRGSSGPLRCVSLASSRPIPSALRSFRLIWRPVVDGGYHVQHGQLRVKPQTRSMHWLATLTRS